MMGIMLLSCVVFRMVTLVIHVVIPVIYGAHVCV